MEMTSVPLLADNHSSTDEVEVTVSGEKNRNTGNNIEESQKAVTSNITEKDDVISLPAENGPKAIENIYHKGTTEDAGNGCKPGNKESKTLNAIGAESSTVKLAAISPLAKSDGLILEEQIDAQENIGDDAKEISASNELAVSNVQEKGKGAGIADNSLLTESHAADNMEELVPQTTKGKENFDKDGVVNGTSRAELDSAKDGIEHKQQGVDFDQNNNSNQINMTPGIYSNDGAEIFALVGCDSALEIIDVNNHSSSKTKENETGTSLCNEKAERDVIIKKPRLKLASFADLRGNGITDDTPVSAMDSLPACGQCNKLNALSFANVVWETMQFCNEKCLGEYQKRLSHCSLCQQGVLASSLGKYCVRFGSEIKQFCASACLQDYKKGLKVCSFCQKDISGPNWDSFLAPIGDKGEFKDFCAQECLQKYEVMYLGKEAAKEWARCAVCKEEKTVEVILISPEGSVKLCGRTCFSSYKFGNTVDTLECAQCQRHYDLKLAKFTIHYEGQSRRFCSLQCRNVYIMKHRHIVPCQWCKVKKYNFDMIEKWQDENEHFIFCSANCLTLHSVSQSSKAARSELSKSLPIIQSVTSLAGLGEPISLPDSLPVNPVPTTQLKQKQLKQTVCEVVKEVMVHQAEGKVMANKSTLTKPFMQTKGISCRPHPCHKETQTEQPTLPALVPVVIPMYMPLPMHMYSTPFPVPIPVPIPIPTPIFIPTTRNSARTILKQIKKIQAKLPADPFEAELLAMAGALVDKKDDDSAAFDSDDSSDRDFGVNDGNEMCSFDRVINETCNINGQQQQLEQEDFEHEVQGGRVVPRAVSLVSSDEYESSGQDLARNLAKAEVTNDAEPAFAGAGQKRRYSQTRTGDVDDCDGNLLTAGKFFLTQHRPPRRHTSRSQPKGTRGLKYARAADGTSEMPPAMEYDWSGVSSEPKERSDAQHHLKFTYGVNAWKNWVVQKNIELEKAQTQGKYMKPFEMDLLKLRSDELSYTLCMFVKEVKKPNGDCYAPDSVFYLSLGIQEYLLENGRIDNIFTDVYYEPFTSALHDVIKDFRLPVNELGYFVTRIEEEHLWEAKQLGAHSPQVLLNTLIYFNTKYFMLKTVEQHKNLSFSHIMKHWKKGPNSFPVRGNQAMQPQSKSILLRYYPSPQKGKLKDERKCYEQHENSENPLRCPVKLYEFYLSKCPESTRNKSDLFYLQPERSCVPDSPVWYSSDVLNNHQLDKMLQRLLIVREVQEHMLASM